MSGYVSFDFKNFNEKGLKSVIAKFKRNKTPVFSVTASNKPKRQRVAGVTTKSADFYFEDGQRLSISVTAQGGVFQVKLNGRIIPIKNTENLDKAVKEISTQVKANSANFSKRLKAKQAAAMGKESKTKKPRQIRTTAAKLREVNEVVASTESSIKSLEQERKKTEEKNNTLSESLSDLLGKIENMLAKKEQLKSELGAA